MMSYMKKATVLIFAILALSGCGYMNQPLDDLCEATGGELPRSANGDCP